MWIAALDGVDEFGVPVSRRHWTTLSGTRVDIGQGDVPWVCLADIEGNDFCVLSPR